VLNPYLRGNYAPVLVERSDDHELPVTGVVPPDLTGQLLRNGPNPALVPADEEDYHWFAGDGMVHAISLADGKAVGYRNRWVRTRALAAKVGTAVPPGGPDEPVDGAANTHVIRHGGQTLALAESGFPHALSADLTRARVYDFDGALASPMTAHPKVDPVSGELHFFGCDVFGPPFLRYHVADAAGALIRAEAIDIPRATMIHDFGMTATRVVFFDLPVLFDLELATVGRSMPYRWAPEAGARIGVMPRNGANDDLLWIGIDPVYAFHVLNAYDADDTVVIDVIRYDRAFDTAPGQAISSVLPTLARWTIDLEARRISEQRLDDAPVEFPRVADAVAGRLHRYGYCTLLGDRADDPTQVGLVQYDLQRDEAVRFDPGPHRFPGEPVFVLAADGRDENEGWVLTVVYDATSDTSDLVILDATSFAGPPVATVHLPVRIPFGFHGSWVPVDS
jgi:carotenoid cleavage dioxygenase